MTQIVSAFAKGFAFQVSDRLVTQNRREFDPQYNKTVIFRARDGIVSISFAGHAYLENFPTDTWIVRTLLRTDHTDFGGITWLPKRMFRTLSLSAAVRELQTGLARAYARLPDMARAQQPIILNIVGHQIVQPGRPTQLYAVEILQDPRDPRLFVVQKSRHQMWRRGLMVQVSPDLPNDLMDELVKSLKTMGIHTTHEPFERALIDGVRRVSRRRPETVGERCISVVLQPLETNRVLLRYADPHTEDTVLARSPGTRAVPLEAYTPYVLYPPHIFAPAGIHGGFDFSIPGPHGTLRCTLVGLKREARATQAFYSPQQRPADPLK